MDIAAVRTTPIERYRNIGIVAHIDAGFKRVEVEAHHSAGLVAGECNFSARRGALADDFSGEVIDRDGSMLPGRLFHENLGARYLPFFFIFGASGEGGKRQ